MILCRLYSTNDKDAKQHDDDNKSNTVMKENDDGVVLTSFARMFPQLKPLEEDFWKDRRKRKKQEKAIEHDKLASTSSWLRRRREIVSARGGEYSGVFTICGCVLGGYILCSWLLEIAFPQPRTTWYREAHSYYMMLSYVRESLASFVHRMIPHCQTSVVSEIFDDVETTVSVHSLLTRCKLALEDMRLSREEYQSFMDELQRIEEAVRISVAVCDYINGKWCTIDRDRSRGVRNLCFIATIVSMYCGVIGGAYVSTMVASVHPQAFLGLEFLSFSSVSVLAFNFTKLVPDQKMYADVDDHAAQCWNDLVLD